MTNKINPCPVCGGQPKFALGGRPQCVYCPNRKGCNLAGPLRETEAEAIAAWNRLSFAAQEPATDGETVEVRVPIEVSPDGSFITGHPGYGRGAVQYTLTARPPIPQPLAPVVVAANVESADD